MKRALTFAILTTLFAFAAVGLFAQGPTTAKVYVCTMCDLAVGKPGKCPECGMNLKEVNKADVSYVCTMCDVKSDKPGKCPKCGMTLKMKLAEPAPPSAPNAK